MVKTSRSSCKSAASDSVLLCLGSLRPAIGCVRSMERISGARKRHMEMTVLGGSGTEWRRAGGSKATVL